MPVHAVHGRALSQHRVHVPFLWVWMESKMQTGHACFSLACSGDPGRGAWETEGAIQGHVIT